MSRDRYLCRWCLRESGHPDDIVNGSCSCCGSDDILLATPCEHRTGSTLYELFRRGVRNVRREPWPDGDYLELPDHGGFVPPFGLLQRPSARDGAPSDVGYGPGVVPTFGWPSGGWEPYTGPTVEHDRPPKARLKAAWHAPTGGAA